MDISSILQQFSPKWEISDWCVVFQNKMEMLEIIIKSPILERFQAYLVEIRSIYIKFR